jgi:hypothetical protein
MPRRTELLLREYISWRLISMLDTISFHGRCTYAMCTSNIRNVAYLSILLRQFNPLIYVWGADKSLAFPISPRFTLILLLSHQSLLFCICLT